ncbi:MAG: hypothetical protein K2J80_04320, partial [Oscillospiraceae bacterium]|nr:hypothetical protein [Oscillospiraceae bacterium]
MTIIKIPHREKALLSLFCWKRARKSEFIKFIPGKAVALSGILSYVRALRCGNENLFGNVVTDLKAICKAAQTCAALQRLSALLMT